MSLILALMLAPAQALPFIDRAALHTLAKVEAARATAPRVSSVRTIAGLCSRARRPSNESASELRRALSMAGPRVSILQATCEKLGSNVGGVRTASR